MISGYISQTDLTCFESEMKKKIAFIVAAEDTRFSLDKSLHVIVYANNRNT